jgi:hypothetical protein
MSTTIIEKIYPEQIAELAKIEEKVVTGYTLADAIREGASVTEQAYNWGSQGKACALTAAALAAKARGYIAG